MPRSSGPARPKPPPRSTPAAEPAGGEPARPQPPAGRRPQPRTAGHHPGGGPARRSGVTGPAADDRERAFEPFQRLGDRDNTTGLGLGLALARGLTEAMNGTLTPEDTRGGGLTMVLSQPVAKDGLEPGPGGMLSTS
ncbi:ATP-binding protein [Streptomyces lavendulae]|uniref:sensor histidine kinase n=1 Tax=Streptomyces lavendulae TaxID=1914 RepID=UPI003F4CD49C